MNILDKYAFRSDCPSSTIIDLKQFIEMRIKGYSGSAIWNDLKHCWVTETMDTIWQLSNEYLKETYPGAIGNTWADLAFFEDMLKRLTVKP